MADKTTPEDAQYRDDLKQAYAVIVRLAAHVPDSNDLARVIQIALEDDAQLRFLLSLITAPPKK